MNISPIISNVQENPTRCEGLDEHTASAFITLQQDFTKCSTVKSFTQYEHFYNELQCSGISDVKDWMNRPPLFL